MQDQNVQYWIESDEDEGSDKDEFTTDPEEANEANHDSNATNSTQADSSANESNVIKSRVTKIPKPVKPNAVVSDYALRRVINPPVRYADEWGNSAIIDEPLTYTSAIKSRESEQWLAAMNDELRSLEKNNTWSLVDRPTDRNIVGCKWVFKLKTRPNDEQPKYKARLVAKGYSQHAGIDYGETFSPVVRYDSVRTILALAAAENLEMVQFDIKTAFLNGDLEEEIYMAIPEGMDGANGGKVCRLRKSLYGLKQASRAWNTKFTDFLAVCGLTQSAADNCVFHGIINGDRVILLLYVDDGMILSSSGDTLNVLMRRLEDAFELTHGNVDFYVGMEIKRDREKGTISIGQSAYVRRIIDKFDMTDANPISTPADTGIVLTKSNGADEPIFPYRQAVGSLMYAATVSRPDISYAVGEVSRFLENPSSEHRETYHSLFEENCELRHRIWRRAEG